MAGGGASSVLEECVRTLGVHTTHPENFLSLQDGAAAEFTSLTKRLYDLQKALEPAGFRGSPLEQLAVQNFDEEQIWQELELQNSAALKFFQSAVKEVLSDRTLSFVQEVRREEDGGGGGTDGSSDEAEERSPRGPPKRRAEVQEKDSTDEESDVDFDVDALEMREKQKKRRGNDGRPQGPPSEVDDRFFKLAEMESFLDQMEKQDGKENDDESDVDYFQDPPSDEDEEDLDFLCSRKPSKKPARSSRNLKYKDYFDAAGEAPPRDEDTSEGEGDEAGAEMDEDDDEEGEEDDLVDDEEEEDDEDGVTGRAKAAQKKVSFNLSVSDSEGEEPEEILGGKTQSSLKSKSPFEKRQEKMAERIGDLEKAALAGKSWQLSGEVTAQSRPENSMLEEDVEFEQTSRMAPAITEETTLGLEDVIKQRIRDQAFDDVERKEKPKENVFEYKKRLTLDHEKSKQSLAEIYEQEYLKQTQQNTEKEEENPAHVGIQKLMDSLFLKLDALSNFHFTPKPPVPEVKVVSNLPSISMEEVAPVSASDATLLAPEEVKEKNRAGDVLGSSEKTATDRKRERRHKKKVKHFKIKEREKRQKQKEDGGAAEDQRLSGAKASASLKKITKGGKATVLKDEGKDKALRSSQAFFSQLQDQVKSQIRSAKDQPAKKQRGEFSATKLKL